MATRNKTVEILGDEAKVVSVQLFPQPKGDVVIVVNGVTLDSEGRPVQLKEAQLVSATKESNAALADLLSIGLAALRKVNGLEDGEVGEATVERGLEDREKMAVAALAAEATEISISK